jgi:transposase
LFGVSVSFVVKLMAAYRKTGSLKAKSERGWRYFKLDPDRDFLMGRVVERMISPYPNWPSTMVSCLRSRAA